MSSGIFIIMAKRLTRSRIKEISSSMVSPLVIGPANPISCSLSTQPKANGNTQHNLAKTEPETGAVTPSDCGMSNLDIKPKSNRKRGNSHIKIEYDIDETEGTKFVFSSDRTKLV